MQGVDHCCKAMDLFDGNVCHYVRTLNNCHVPVDHCNVTMDHCGMYMTISHYDIGQCTIFMSDIVLDIINRQMTIVSGVDHWDESE